MKDKLIEDVIKISSQLVTAKELLCSKYSRNGDFCDNCPLYKLDDCTDLYSLASVEYNRETGKYE